MELLLLRGMMRITNSDSGDLGLVELNPYNE